MRVASSIRTKLTEALRPDRLEIVDESHLHAGHHHPGQGAHRAEGETHFRVTIVSATFEGMSRLQRQRRVYDLLAQEISEGVHALSLTTRTPVEEEKSRIG